MCTNVEVLDPAARVYYMLQSVLFSETKEQEIELAHAVIKAMDPELISLADEDADAKSVALKEEREGVSYDAQEI